MIIIFLIVGVGIGLAVGICQVVHDSTANREPPEIDQNTLDKITMLELIIERRKQSAYILELELENATGKRKATLLNKLNTLDRQTYKDMQELNKLKESQV